MPKEKHFLASFASDNYSGVSPEVMQALLAANVGHVPAYGGDRFTSEAVQLFREEFGQDTHIFFTFTATASNVASMASITRPFHSIIMAETAHMHILEVGAIYAHTGCKPLLIPSSNGKIHPDQITEKVKQELFEGVHGTIPHVVSLSQATELGTIYTLKEIQDISETCRKHRLLLHVDGCRIFNAAASLGLPLKAFGKEAGIDVLVFGGTKNGLMSAEAVVFFKPELAEYFPYIQKQRLQLASKMRFLAVQYIPFLRDGLWKKNAEHANGMASLLADGLRKIPKIEFVQKVETNLLFVKMPPELIQKLQKDFLFLVRDAEKGIVRLVTSFDTKKEEIELFLKKAH